MQENFEENSVCSKSEQDGTISDKKKVDDDDSPETIVKRENKAVFYIRIIILLVILLASACTGIIVYVVISNAEQESFEAEFDGIANKIVASLVADTSLKFWMARTLANSVTLALETSGLPATEITIPQARWERATQEIKFVARSDLVSWGPFIYNDTERDAFEKRTKEQQFFVGAEAPCFVCNGNENQIFSNPETVFEIPGFGSYSCQTIERAGRRGIIPTENCGLNMQITAPHCNCVDIPEGTLVDSNILAMPEKIFRYEDGKGAISEPIGAYPYHPIYQISIVEVNDLPVMYNQLSEVVRATAINEMLKSKVPVLSNIYVRESEFYEKYTGRNGEAASVLYYPVVDPSGEEIVASVSVELLWADFVTAVLPENSDLVDIIVTSSCGQSLTFRYEPISSTFFLRGQGDLHDSRFHDMVRFSTIAQYEGMIDFLSPSDKNHEEMAYCRYNFTVYATEELEDKSLSNEPAIYALVTATIFLFTSFVFIAYDRVVHRRQVKIMASAKRTNEIVAALFPSNVRSRMYQRQESTDDNGTSTVMVSNAVKDYVDDGNQNNILGSDPIADLFPDATILFLDIAGFTKWSSDHNPQEVFRLLETIYNSFDKAARRFGVFKIETIGDCYVAATGLPEARKDHAVVMARFAKVCLEKFSTIIKELEIPLGPSTTTLRARAGLHSGPVTAGVLRGEKARFQIFGDTVNMASRMESTCEPMRIQVSKATADLLIQAGKEHWIRPRENLVNAKGKGELQTYWVFPSDNSSVATSNTLESSTDDNEAEKQGIDPILTLDGSFAAEVKLEI